MTRLIESLQALNSTPSPDTVAAFWEAVWLTEVVNTAAPRYPVNLETNRLHLLALNSTPSPDTVASVTMSLSKTTIGSTGLEISGDYYGQAIANQRPFLGDAK